MFYLSRENYQTKENLYSNIFFSLENVLPQLFGFFYIYFANYNHNIRYCNYWLTHRGKNFNITWMRTIYLVFWDYQCIIFFFALIITWNKSRLQFFVKIFNNSKKAEFIMLVGWNTDIIFIYSLSTHQFQKAIHAQQKVLQWILVACSSCAILLSYTFSTQVFTRSGP